MRDPKSKNRDPLIVTRFFLFVLIGTPAIALGAVHAAVAGIYFALAAVFLVYLFGIRKSHAPPLDLPAAAALGLIAFTLFQIVPLPSFIVRYIAPSVFEVRARAWAPLHYLDAPSFMPLSLDVTFTVMEAGKLAFYLAVYWGVLFSVRRLGPNFILRLITAAGVLCAGIFLAHKILLLDKIYGFYTPLFVTVTAGRDRLSAPLVNANHMAGFLGLCAAVAVGQALAAEERSRKLVGIGIAAIIGGSMMLTLSRGGIAAFIGGQCLFVLMRVLIRRKKDRRDVSTGHVGWLPIGLALSLGLGLFAAQDAIIGEFLGGNIKKLDLFFEGLPLIGRFWTTGVGRGAFWVGFHMVSGLGSDVTATHAENAIVQLLADFGVFIGTAALCAAALIVGRFLRRPPERVECAAALSALVAFGIHNLVDFNMEIMGVAVIPAALIGVLRGCETPKQRPVPATRVSHFFVWGTVATAAVSSAAAFLYVRPHSVDAEEKRFRQALSVADFDIFSEESLKTVLERHPADAYIPFLTGVRLYHLKTENPLPWFARSAELHPYSADTHFYIGGTLLRAGRLEQAMLELRLAARSKPGLAGAAARLLVPRAPRFSVLSKIAVTDEDKILLWPSLAREFSIRGLSEEAETADLAVLQINPDDPLSSARHIRRLLSRGELEEAQKLAEKLAKHPDFGPSGIALEAEIYEKMKRFDQSALVIEKGIQKFGNHPTLLRSLAWARQRAGDFEGAIRAAQILKSESSDARSQTQAVMLEADLHIADNRIQGALARLREAHALDPTNVGILERIYSLAGKHHDRKRALEALRLLTQLNPSDAKLQAQLEEYEDELKLQHER